ncbi:MAG: SBBP repeat-containing protein [Solirubrobacterales bacterium]|nr:SBBP repeat-containing protein [Solirubrobacterales bacterium]
MGPFGLVAVAALVVAAIALVIILRSGDNGKPSLDKGDTKVSIERSYGKLPLAFEPNAGRYPAGLRYRARSESGSVLLSRSGAELIAASQKPNRFALEFTGGSPTSVVGDDKLDGVVNDLRGDDPARYRTGIPTYAAVRYRRIWSGIDAVYRGTQRRLDYDFRVAPGADPQDIGVRVRGADRLRLAENGDVVITTGGSKFLQKAPVSFQPAANGDARASVESRYTLQGNRIGLEIGDYDRSRPLQIDPVVVTYFASDGAPEDLSDIAVDASGSAYVVGQDEPDEDTYTPDVFVGNYAPDGESFVYSTYLGGTSDDYGSSIAIDSAGAAYITGFTYSSTFPTVNEIQACTGASYLHSEAFVTKLAPDGGSLTYSTCLGGSDYDYGRGIAVDGSGSAYVAGATDSSDFNRVGGIEGNEGGQDAFVSKLAPNGGSLVYSTYLGGGGDDAGNGIAVDASGSAYLTGSTESSDFNRVGGIEGDEGMKDAFISKLAPNGSSLVYSTYLGGSSDDAGNGIAVDASGSAFVAGATDSSDFNRVGGIEGDEGGKDAFVSKLAPNGASLAYSTYLGGGGSDFASDVAVDSTGSAHVTGGTSSEDFGADGWTGSYYYGSDDFVFQLNPAGSSLVFLSVTRANISESGQGIAVDSAGDTYVVDSSGGTMKLVYTDTTPPDTTITSGPANGATIKTNSVDFGFSSSETDSTFACRLDSGAWSSCTSPKSYSNLSNGSHRFAVRATDPAENTDQTPATRDFTVNTTVYRARISKVSVSGPARVKRKKKVTYKVRITNSGNASATGVRLKVSGRGVGLKKSAGKIGARKTRTVKIGLRFKKTGKVKVTFKVTSGNAGGKTVKKNVRVRK